MLRLAFFARMNSLTRWRFTFELNFFYVLSMSYYVLLKSHDIQSDIAVANAETH